jgi:hypothetical protein
LGISGGKQLITHSYIGQQPVYLEALKCHIYPTPDYEVPEPMEPIKPKPQCYSNQYKKQHSNTHTAIVQWLAEHGPATARVIGLGIGKSDQAVRCSIAWYANAFVELGRADDARRSVIWGLVGQTLDDMTVNCGVERMYHRIINYLSEHGEARVTAIAQAVSSTDSRVSSCLSNYRDVFQNIQVGRYDFVWKLKEGG